MTSYLITGSSRGLGLEFVRQLTGRGDRVIATCRRPNEARELQALSEALGEQLQVLPLDVTSQESVERARRMLDDLGSEVDVLLNNAGIMGPYGPGIRELEVADVQRVLDVNLHGVIRVTQAFVPLVAKSDTSRIVNMTSLMGSIGDNQSGAAYAYRISKAALNMLTVNLDRELRTEGITVFCMHPGWVQTDMGGGSAPVRVSEAIPPMIGCIDEALPHSHGGRFFYPLQDREAPW